MNSFEPCFDDVPQVVRDLKVGEAMIVNGVIYWRKNKEDIPFPCGEECCGIEEAEFYCDQGKNENQTRD